MQTHEFSGRRWSINSSQKPFDDVVAAVEGKIGRPNFVGEFVARMAAAETYEEMRKVVQNSVKARSA